MHNKGNVHRICMEVQNDAKKIADSQNVENFLQCRLCVTLSLHPPQGLGATTGIR
jgi:hypothetical protein